MKSRLTSNQKNSRFDSCRVRQFMFEPGDYVFAEVDGGMAPGTVVSMDSEGPFMYVDFGDIYGTQLTSTESAWSTERCDDSETN